MVVRVAGLIPGAMLLLQVANLPLLHKVGFCRDKNNQEFIDHLNDFMGGVGGMYTSFPSQSNVPRFHNNKARSHSVNRVEGAIYSLQQTSAGNQHGNTNPGNHSRRHSGQSTPTGKGKGQSDHRERPHQNDVSGFRRLESPFPQTHRAPHQQFNSSGSRQRHKSPARGVYSQHETRQFSVFQPENLSLGNRTQSMQNLSHSTNHLNREEKNSSTDFKEKRPHNKQKVDPIHKKIDQRTITKLSTLEPAEMIMQLAAPRSGLIEFLNETNYDFQVVQSFLKVLNEAIGCTASRQNLIHILRQVQNSAFLHQTISYHFLNYSTNHAQESRPFSPIEHTLVLLTELASVFPFSSFMEVTVAKTIVQKAIDDLKKCGKTCPQDIQVKMDSLNNLLKHLEEKKRQGTLRSDNSIYFVGSRDLIDDDFRSTSIYPTHEDIYLAHNPILRPNLIHGSYPDTKTYLDTHFRLLREDFIRPLRDGISKLLTLKDKEIVKTKFDNIRIYFGTQITAPVFTKNGIIHTVKFNTSNLQEVRWESSKRLLYGSLVCLSKDNFKNMLFATVADRSVSDLKNGLISLMFTEESRQKLAQHVVADTYLMVEATAYFEAYRHVLEGLKEMVESDVPFKNNIIHCNTGLSPPIYLSQNSSGYSLEMLVEKHTSTQVPLPNHNPYFHQDKPPFHVLDHNTWPTKEQLGLDNSQFRALQMTLTNELSIIQGPPGTGKTFVGLKIVHALLSNSEVWKEGHSPILIVCYTNHALDQFLEGILSYKTCNIVRVGSRSNSEILQNCSLSKIRNQKTRTNLPGYMRALHAEMGDEKKKVQEKLLEKASQLRVATIGILHESVLVNFITENHFKSLMDQQEYMDSSKNSVMVEWLSISTANYASSLDFNLLDEACLVDESDRSFSNSNVLEEETNEDFIKIDEEAELAERERMIEEDDDVKQQILMAQRRAARAKREILAFIPDENDVGDQGTEEEEWQMQKEVKKKMKKRIKHELDKTSHMDEATCNEIDDLWSLPLTTRWEVYRLWRAKYLTSIRDDIFTFENIYQILVNRSNELRSQEDQLILQEADIIGMTTTGAAKHRKLLQTIQPKIVVVEEAAEVLEAHIVTTLSSGCQHLILIGDHQQLRPSTTDYDLARNFNLEVSMFERLIKMNIPYVRLDYQHRMRPEIARLLTPHIYDKLENHDSVLKFENIKGVCSNLFFVTHTHPEEHIREGKSHQNSHEADFVKSLCLYFLQQGYQPSQITILTTYSGQLYCIQKKMPRSTFEGVRVCVVDKFQGEENDIVILSLVRSNSVGSVGFLQIPNRVCVALSRAKKGLFCIGNMQLLSKVPLWKKMNEVLTENGQIGSELKLQCANHPNNINYVSVSEDFTRVPEGGCMNLCEYRLDCGHVCTLRCHPYDPEHKSFKCLKECIKVPCENGHKCTKPCGEPCGKCSQMVPKKISTCGHMQDMSCSFSPDKFVCKEPCTKILECGHPCVRTCGQICTQKCPEKVDIILECGHSNKTLCHLKSDVAMTGEKLICKVHCQEELPCGHSCPGICNSCKEQGSHMNCTKPCDTVLLCSHRCDHICSSECFCICSCENKCFHKKCFSKCSDPCQPCMKQCGWKCKHKSCTNRCWEPCNRDPCDEPCSKKLHCGHPCIGFCGEPCPNKCRICNADEVNENVFGKKVYPDAKFVQLLDCPHMFEVTSFTEWMNQEEEGKVIKLKSCPKCLIPIRRNVRYGNLIKQTLLDLESVKERIVGKWLNCLEVFLCDNEAEFKHFPAIERTMQKLKENIITLRMLMLVSEKLIFWKKLGSIKNRLEPFSPAIVSWANTEKISDLIELAPNKHRISDLHYDLFKLVLKAEYIILKEKGLVSYIGNITALVDKMEKQAITLDDARITLRKIPLHMEMVSIIENKNNVLNMELLKQGMWHKCSAGHIYNGHIEEEELDCPQCTDEDSDDEDQED
ncbi:Hypothetical predicted protein [Pelobates cultripes]|uniref:NFX1-type zinc finger-containing protein 1 n=1 Tax=Pelobates cultripes TaxID=61616 RepID=A0AAD1W4G4_PELCU|nr:Hypothetical predicted protein [Pelobates cultripes]